MNKKEYGKKWRENNKEGIKKYRKKNPNKIKEAKRRHYQKHKEKIREKQKRYYQKNKKEIREKKKLYYKDNLEEIGKYRKEYYKKNGDYVRKKSREWKRKNRERDKENRIIRLYGINFKGFNEILKSQNNMCKICGILIEEKNLLDRRKNGIVIDHNHKTGKVRGILCSPCNYILGNAKDNKKILKEAINYLEENE